MAVCYCSSKDCDHFENYGTGRNDSDPSKFCTKCGSKTISSCPSCDHYRKSINDIFCGNCGKPYK